MNRSTFQTSKYMNGSVSSKAIHINGVGFEILARTPLPQLPPSYPLPLETRCWGLAYVADKIQSTPSPFWVLSCRGPCYSV